MINIFILKALDDEKVHTSKAVVEELEISVLKVLYDRKVHTNKELAKQLEVSEWRVRKAISCLKENGVKIETIRGKNGGYILLEKIKYGKI